VTVSFAMNLLSLLLLAVLQTTPSAKGVWEGPIVLPGQELAFSATLIQTADKWTGTFDIPMQGARGVPMSTLSVAGSVVSFTIPGPGQPTFQLTIAPDGKTMSGTLAQGGA